MLTAGVVSRGPCAAAEPASAARRLIARAASLIYPLPKDHQQATFPPTYAVWSVAVGRQNPVAWPNEQERPPRASFAYLRLPLQRKSLARLATHFSWWASKERASRVVGF